MIQEELLIKDHWFDVYDGSYDSGIEKLNSCNTSNTSKPSKINS